MKNQLASSANLVCPVWIMECLASCWMLEQCYSVEFVTKYRRVRCVSTLGKLFTPLSLRHGAV